MTPDLGSKGAQRGVANIAMNGGGGGGGHV